MRITTDPVICSRDTILMTRRRRRTKEIMMAVIRAMNIKFIPKAV
jgi:hypothetical protein